MAAYPLPLHLSVALTATPCVIPQAEIHALKDTYDGVFFKPHVTLAAFEAADDESAKKIASDVARKLQVLSCGRLKQAINIA